MIYGITIVLNDCNFRLKTRESQVQERYSFQAFFTNRKQAITTWENELRRVKHEMGISYGSRELRGRCELYKANVSNGKIMHYGTIISEQKI